MILPLQGSGPTARPLAAWYGSSADLPLSTEQIPVVTQRTAGTRKRKLPTIHGYLNCLKPAPLELEHLYRRRVPAQPSSAQNWPSSRICRTNQAELGHAITREAPSNMSGSGWGSI